MKTNFSILIILSLLFVQYSCVSKKQFYSLQSELDNAKAKVEMSEQKATQSRNLLKENVETLNATKRQTEKVQADLTTAQNTIKLREEQLSDLRNQLGDCQEYRNKQLTAVGDLTVLSKAANDNIKETLNQMQDKDKYIRYLLVTKTKTDSLNLALAMNLKSVLKKGIDDEDIEVKVDKTVVFVNLSDKMLYQSGSARLTPRANEVLGKIAQIINSRPDLEVMVEGYTDNVPISSECIQDNWDLSVKRATSVVRILQESYNIDPNRLIAAGRGEFNMLATNATPEGRSMNRRTRIIILPKLNQFYDLLNPANAPQ